MPVSPRRRLPGSGLRRREAPGQAGVDLERGRRHRRSTLATSGRSGDGSKIAAAGRCARAGGTGGAMKILFLNGGLPASALVEVGPDHWLNDAQSLAAMVTACERGTRS